MCKNMKELQTVSEKIFELEQKKAKKKKEVDAQTMEKSNATAWSTHSAIS